MSGVLEDPSLAKRPTPGLTWPPRRPTLSIKRTTGLRLPPGLALGGFSLWARNDRLIAAIFRGVSHDGEACRSKLIPHGLRDNFRRLRRRFVDASEGRIRNEIRELDEVRLARVLWDRVIKKIREGRLKLAGPELATGGAGTSGLADALSDVLDVALVVAKQDLGTPKAPLQTLQQVLPCDVGCRSGLVELRKGLLLVDHDGKASQAELGLKPHVCPVEARPRFLAQRAGHERTAVPKEVVGFELGADWHTEPRADEPAERDQLVKRRRPLGGVNDYASEHVALRAPLAVIPRLIDIGDLHAGDIKCVKRFHQEPRLDHRRSQGVCSPHISGAARANAGPVAIGKGGTRPTACGAYVLPRPLDDEEDA